MVPRESELCCRIAGVSYCSAFPLTCVCSASGGKAAAAGRVRGCGISLGQREKDFLLGLDMGCISSSMC